ncbi:MAG: amidohydrolase family protein [Desulfatibacillaceae bacterium]
MYDCHFHHDPDVVPLDGLIASMDAHGIERTAVIPPLCVDIEGTKFAEIGIGLFRRGITSRIRPLRRAWRALYNSWPREGNQVDIGGKLYDIASQPDNEPVLEAVEQHPDRLWGWIFVNPEGPSDPLREIERCSAVPGMIGVKAHPFWHRYPVRKLMDTAALCRDKGLPMLIHLGAGEYGDFKLLPEKLPGLKVLYAHAGLPYQTAVCDYTRTSGGRNVFVDLACTAYVDQRIAAMALEVAGPARCLFGTDGPYFHHANGRFDFSECLEVVTGQDLSEADKRRVLRDNFLKLVNG